MRSKRIDFSTNARVYDRRHGTALSDEALERLWTGAVLEAGARVLDVGAGTGRVAIPLAHRGCEVVAVEPASGMLNELRTKALDAKILTVRAEGASLPFPAASFDAVVIARLLYLTPDWTAMLREAHRVLIAGGRLLHEWGNGQHDEEWVRIREEARRLFEHAGLSAPFHPGARSEKEIDDTLDALHFTREGEVGIGPGQTITLREFLRRLIQGELSYIWDVPQDVRTACLPALERWCERTFDLDRPVPMPRELRWTIYRRDAA